MSLEKLLDCVKNHNTIITASPGNGATSLVLAIADQLARDGELVLFYNTSNTLDAKFIRRYYSNAYTDVLFVVGNLDQLYEILSDMDFNIRYLIVDPADVMMSRQQVLDSLGCIAKTLKINLLCTSQIRFDLTHGGKPYSTLEEFNRSRYKIGSVVFDYSIWIRNATAPNDMSVAKYADIYEVARTGNIGTERCLLKYSREGNIIK